MRGEEQPMDFESGKWNNQLETKPIHYDERTKPNGKLIYVLISNIRQGLSTNSTFQVPLHCRVNHRGLSRTFSIRELSGLARPWGGAASAASCELFFTLFTRPIPGPRQGLGLDTPLTLMGLAWFLSSLPNNFLFQLSTIQQQVK